jgi:hypothetical protein
MCRIHGLTFIGPGLERSFGQGALAAAFKMRDEWQWVCLLIRGLGISDRVEENMVQLLRCMLFRGVNLDCIHPDLLAFVLPLLLQQRA